MKEFGIGIIGYGFMGKAHTYAYRTMPLYYENLPFRIRLVGICNRTLEKAQRAKEDLGFEFATDDPNELFAADNIDIINICTPNNLHKDHVIGALKAGKHVYCDKPQPLPRGIGGDFKVLGSTRPLPKWHFRTILPYHAGKANEARLSREVLSFRASYLHSGSVDPERPWDGNWKICRWRCFGRFRFPRLDLIYHLLGRYKEVFAYNRILYPKRPSMVRWWM